MTSISKADVIAAQQAWGEGIVAISKAHSDGGDFKARATQHINTLYAYGGADVMFKPTMAAVTPFRDTFEGALSYFIGQEGTCLLYTSPSPRDLSTSRMPSSA